METVAFTNSTAVVRSCAPGSKMMDSELLEEEAAAAAAARVPQGSDHDPHPSTSDDPREAETYLSLLLAPSWLCSWRVLSWQVTKVVSVLTRKKKTTKRAIAVRPSGLEDAMACA